MMMEWTCMSGFDVLTCLLTYWLIYLFISFLTALLYILVSGIRIGI